MVFWSKRGATPLEGIDALLMDLDGVVYRGREAIPYAVDALAVARDGCHIGYITNNASRTSDDVARHLESLGVAAAATDVVTSPQVAVAMVKERVDPGAIIHIVGGEGLISEVEKAGFSITQVANDESAALLQGFAPTVGWTQLAEAAFGLQRDIPWIATNMDWTIPLARGLAPGNGTLVSAVHTAVGRLPDVAGKPEPGIFELARRRFSAKSPLCVGDRLDTDILGANRAGMPSALVLTGVDQAKQLLAADKTMRPRYILGDLRDLHRPYPETVMTDDGREATVGRAAVRLRGKVVDLIRAGDGGPDLLRACCSLIWGSGQSIHSLDVSGCLSALGIIRN